MLRALARGPTRASASRRNDMMYLVHIVRQDTGTDIEDIRAWHTRSGPGSCLTGGYVMYLVRQDWKPASDIEVA